MELYTNKAFITFYLFLCVYFLICGVVDLVSGLSDCFEFILIISVQILITINGFKPLKSVPLTIACPRLDTTDGPL